MNGNRLDLRRPLRILFISRAFPPVVGGIEKQNFELYRHLGQIAEVGLIANTRGKRLLPIFLPYAFLLSLLRATQHDVILLGDGLLAILGAPLRRLTGKPVACILHGLDVTYSRPFYQLGWIRYFLPSLDRLLPVSRQTMIAATDRGLDAQRCVVVPNGVAPQEFGQSRKDSRRWLDEKVGQSLGSRPVLLTLGRLVERKGIAWFVDQVMPRLHPDVVYVVAGNGPMRRAIARAIVDRKLSDRVFMIGSVSEQQKRCLYQAADIFVQPNIRVAGDMEGFGLVVLEAAASGCAVVASGLEGLQDAIVDGENGILAVPGEADEFVEKIDDLLRNDSKRKELAIRAHEFVEKHYAWEQVAKRYLEACEELAYRHRGLSL